MKYDVAIIGTGPAGGMAACSLANTGLNVVVLEKEELPRHKSCGGAMPSCVKGFFDWDIDPVIEKEITRMKSLYNFRQPHTVTSENAPVILVNRNHFDADLVHRALDMGKGSITLREGVKVSRVEEKETHVVISADRSAPVYANYLIAADGAGSKTALCLGLNRDRSNAIAIDAEVEVTTETYDTESEQMTFNYYCVPCGYGWIFPKKDNLLSCGIGVWEGRTNMKKAMSAFLERSFLPGTVKSVKYYGHPIPIYSGHRMIASKRTCLAGDAASLVDPILGEGIRYALKSGMIAANVIAGLSGVKIDSGLNDEITSSGLNDCSIYQSLIYEYICNQLEILYRFKLLPYLKAPEFYYNQYVLGH